MAERNIDIGLNIDGSDAKRTVGELKNEMVETVNQSKSLKAQLREITNELNAMADAGKENTDEFLQLQVRAGELRDQIGDTAAAVNAMAGTVTERLGKSFASIAKVGLAAFQGIEGSMAMFGVESENAQKVMAQLQGAMAVSSAITEFGQLGDTITNLKLNFLDLAKKIGLVTVAEKAQTAATEGATVAQYSLNTAMLANPIFLVIAAVTALVAAYVIFSSSADDASNSTSKLTENIQNAKDAFNDYKTTILGLYGTQNEINTLLKDKKVIEAQDRLTDILRNRPDDYKAIYDAQMDLNAAELNAAENNKIAKLEEFDMAAKLDKKRYEQIYKDIDDLNKKRSVGSDEEKAARIKLMADLKKEQNEIFNRQLYLSDKRQALEIGLDNSIYKIRVDGANKLADLTKQQRDKEAAEEEKAKKKKEDFIIQKTKIEQDYIDSLLPQQKREEKVVTDKYEALIKEAEFYKLDTTKLEEAKAAELKKIGDKYENEEKARLKRIADAAKKQKDNILQQEEDFLDRYERETMNANDLEIRDVNDKYFELITLAEQYGLDTKKLKEKQAAEIAEINKKANDENIKSVDENYTKMMNNILAVEQAMSASIGALFDLRADKLSREKNELDKKHEAELSNLKEGTAEYAAAKKRQAEEDDKLARKNFEANKRMQLAIAIANAALAITNIIATTPKADFGIATIALLASTAITNAAAIAKIASTQYEGSSTDTGVGGGGFGGSNFTPSTFYNLGNGTPAPNNNGGGGTKVYVLEKDITKIQRKVSVIERRSTLGN